MRRAFPSGEVEAAATFRTELRRFLRATEAVTSKEGLTPERYDLMLMIEAAETRGEAVTVSALRDKLQLPQQGVTELVKRATQAGLIARERSKEDGRVYFLRPTEQGQRLFISAFRALRADRAAFAESLDRLHHSFQALAPAETTRSRQQGCTRSD